MPRTMVMQELTAQPMRAIRLSTTITLIGRVLDRLPPEVFAYLEPQGIAPAAPPTVRYLERPAGDLVIEGGLAIASPAPASGRITLTELPGGRAAVTDHFGPQRGARRDPHGDRGLDGRAARAPNGVPWEVYWTDPEQEPDPSK